MITESTEATNANTASRRAQIAILISTGTDGTPLADYALRVAEKWRLGRAGRDDGLLILIVPSPAAVRLEVDGEQTETDRKRGGGAENPSGRARDEFLDPRADEGQATDVEAGEHQLRDEGDEGEV